MNRETLNRFFERGILALVLGILVFAPLAFGAVDAWEFLVVQGLTVGVLFLWGMRLWISSKPQLLWPPICWPVLAFAVYAVVRYCTADIEYVARLEMIQVLVCAFLFFAVVNNLYRQESIVAFSVVNFAVAAGISAYAIAQLLIHADHIWNVAKEYPGRASGTFFSPNNFAGFLDMLLPLAVAYIIVGRMHVIVRILLCYGTLMLAGGMAVTFSRGGWIASACGMLVLLLVLLGHRNHRWWALLLLMVMIGGGSFFVSHYLSKTTAYVEHVEGKNKGNDFDMASRFDIWRSAEAMWKDHFWFGVGPGHFDYRFREYRPETLQMRPDRVHNDYLNLLADWGTAGGVIVAVGIGCWIYGLARTWRHVRRAENDFGSGRSNRFAFFLGGAAGLVALLVHSLVDFNLHIPANAILGVTLLAFLTSNLRFATERFWFTATVPVRVAVTITLVAGVLYLGGQGIRRSCETVWLARAGQYPQLFSPERKAALEKAFAAEPKNFETAYALGEMARSASFQGGENYETQAKEALQWYDRVIALDPYDAYGWLRIGMCYDWMGRTDESWKYYDRAELLDPNGYFTVGNIGWHFVQTGEYAAAKPWFERSLHLDWAHNSIARNYLNLVEKKMLEKASGQSLLPQGF